MPSEPTSVLAFLDEYGVPSLEGEQPELGSHFILTAVLVQEQDLGAVRATVERARKKYAAKGEALRSAQLGPEAFAGALALVAEAPFTFYSVVVDKPLLPIEPGVLFTESLHKLLAGMLYRQLFTHHPSLHVTASDHGRASFMNDFGDYLLRHHASSLFDRPRLRFASSQEEPLVQLADLVTGALSRTYRQVHPESTALLDVIRPAHALQIDEWPVRYRPAPGASALRPTDPSDDDVARYALRAAEDFIAAHADAVDEDVRGQVLVLARLLFEARFSNPRAYLQTEILRQALAPVGKANESLHWLRSNVIAPLRDAGVLIASSARGYKIPLTIADVTDFVLRTDTVVHPMLHRVARARDAVWLVTKGRVDVLADTRFELLRAAVDAASRSE